MDHSPNQSQLAASAVAATQPSVNDRRLGSLLVNNGMISNSQISSVLARAHKDRIPFGQAALRSKLITATELDRIIALQFHHKLANPSNSRISREVITAFSVNHRVTHEMRSLRSQLMLQWLADRNEHNGALAIVSPKRLSGRSFLAANLAVAFAQSGHRTLLVDGDLRNPRQHGLFGLANATGFSSVLSGRSKDSFVYRLNDIPGLSIMSAGGIPPNPTELLLPSALKILLDRCARKYQVVIIDTPSVASGSDAGLIASQTSGYIMLGNTGVTAYKEVEGVSRSFAGLGARLVGSVMTSR